MAWGLGLSSVFHRRELVTEYTTFTFMVGVLVGAAAAFAYIARWGPWWW